MPLPKRYAREDKEKLDTTPMEMPAHAFRPLSIEEQIAKFLQHQREYETNSGYESFEEANDFDWPEDDFDQLDFSHYELKEIQEEYIESEEASQAAKEAPQEEIATKEGASPRLQEETPSGASE